LITPGDDERASTLRIEADRERHSGRVATLVERHVGQARISALRDRLATAVQAGSPGLVLDLRLALAMALASHGDRQAAGAVLAEARAAVPASFTDELESAEAALDGGGQLAALQDAVDTATATQDDHAIAIARVELGLALFDAGQAAEALPHLEAAVMELSFSNGACKRAMDILIAAGLA